MKKAEIAKRFGLFIVSLFFIGIGIALTKRADIGISPISSVANVISMRYTFFSFGTWTVCTYLVFLLGQILLLRRQFKLFELLQIPLSFLCGLFTDLGCWFAQFLPASSYVTKLLLVGGGSVILGLGITFGIIAGVMLNSPEAFVKALSITTKKKFGNLKILFDICMVTIATILSLVLFDGKLLGVREGTVIAAVLVGCFVNIFSRLLREPLTKLLVPREGN